MASPVQVILNPENYEEAREGGGGGPRRDFFANRDAAFVRHRAALVGQITGIADTLQRQPQGDVGVIKVILRREAWAKSHRPNRALFKANRIRITGGGDLGELFYEARPTILRAIAEDIGGAEPATNLKPDKNGKLVPHPSAARSETGAIDRIELYGPSDRANFSAETAVAWLRNPMTGSGYQIELFDVPPPRPMWDAADTGKQQLYTSFVEGLAALGRGAEALRVGTRERRAPELLVRLGRSPRPPLLKLQLPAQGSKPERMATVPFDADIGRHQRLLKFLTHHPLVRRVELPPVLKRSVPQAAARARPEDISLPARSTSRSYPKLGIIDGGLSDVLGDWIVHRWDLLADEHVRPDHGTFIGGLAVSGSSLNGGEVCPEADGAELVDIAIFPDDGRPQTFATYYQSGPTDFFAELETAVSDVKARFGTRVFNLSLNVQQPTELDRYSPYAAQLDAIADANDCIFVISAGNIEPADQRPEWPADETRALVALASARNDGLLMPAESVRNMSVAAINPAGLPNVIAHAPTRYSRRGPGLRAGVKPDLAHAGGSGSPQSPLGHGLFSIAPNGSVVDGCGTSYAAPLVAKTAATLEHGIEGEVSRETLMGLMLHHAKVPECLNSRALKAVSRDLVGFGIPPGTQDILEGGDHQITLVMATRIRRDQQISFRFAWPASLVTASGQCRGRAQLTLVSTPPLDTRFGAEFLRINIDAALHQEVFGKDGRSHWKGRLEPVYLPDRNETPAIEAERIEHGLKWSPVKAFAKTFPRGVGETSNWRLFVSYLTRSDEVIPDEGVPFTAILTISDPDGEAPVFNDARALLQRSGVRIEDIRIAARVSTRV